MHLCGCSWLASGHAPHQQVQVGRTLGGPSHHVARIARTGTLRHFGTFHIDDRFARARPHHHDL
jgi:hypothetical protein